MTIYELQSRFLRRAAIAHVLYLLIFGAAVALWLQHDAIPTTLPILLACAAPAILALILAFTFGPDYQQNLLRLFAAAGFVPILLLMWAGSLDAHDPAVSRLVWPWAIAFVLVHAAAFVASVMWLGSAGSRIPAQPGAPVVSLDVLQARLLSLNHSGHPSANHAAPFEMSRSKPDELTVWFARPSADGRRLSVILNFDDAAHHVRVRERLYLHTAAPQTPSEASLRGPGDASFDPARPNATSVSATQAQVTPIDLTQLNAVPVTFGGQAATLPASFSIDETSMLFLFCAVVTRSGWNWRPAFFGDN